MTTPSSTTTAPARFLLLGDSHAGPIGRAAQAAGIGLAGGPLDISRRYPESFYDLGDGDVVFRKPATEQHYREFLAVLGVARMADLRVPVVSTLGFGVHVVAAVENWRIYRDDTGGFPPGFIGGGLFDEIITTYYGQTLDLYRHIRGMGVRVLGVMPPQRVPPEADPEVFFAAQQCIRRELLRLGVEVPDLRSRVTDETGFQRPELCDPDDFVHGNLAFGRLVLADLLDRGL
ncbi:hypothetical protein [Micromonospora rosaria]|uniref:hypothetical protein n=1 Tax=Micromonospora rosaria TaxID=47874 RepID=UPI000A60FCBC|nr:hypothetical protein [Micromonospora rosaria]